MDTIVIETLEDFDNALPRFTSYAPEEGSIIVADIQAKPVAVLTPEMMDYYGHGSAEALANDLAVFYCRSVILYQIGHAEHLSSVTTSLNLTDTKIIATRTLDPVRAADLFKNLPSREEYILNGGQKVLDEAYETAERIIAGKQER